MAEFFPVVLKYEPEKSGSLSTYVGPNNEDAHDYVFTVEPPMEESWCDVFVAMMVDKKYPRDSLQVTPTQVVVGLERQHVATAANLIPETARRANEQNFANQHPAEDAARKAETARAARAQSMADALANPERHR